MQPGARYLSQNQLVDFGTVAAPTSLGTAVRVASVSRSSNPATTVDTVQVSGTYAGVSQCETFVFNNGAGGSGVEMQGIRGIVDVYTQANIWSSNAFFGATLQNISRATNDRWNASVLANSATERVIDGDLMQTAFDTIHTESGEEPDLIMGEHNSIRAFLDSVSADRRYNSPEFAAGMSSLSYNGVRLERDRLAPFNELLVCKKDALKVYTLLDLEFADDDGSVLLRVSNQDSWEGFLRTYKNLGLDDNPKKTLFIRDIRI